MKQAICAAAVAAVISLAVSSDQTTLAWQAQVAVDSATAVIEGRVAYDDAGQRLPVRRAKVTVSRTEPNATSVEWTDGDGQYRMLVNPGNVRIRIEKPGFVSTTSNTTAAETELDLSAGRVSTFDAVMARAGAIEGRFLLDGTRPIFSLDVIARPENAAPDSRNVFTTLTDDLGRFRLHTLPPGRYRVSAAPPPPASGDRLYLPGTHNEADAALVEVTSGVTAGFFEVTAASAQPAPGAVSTDTHPINHAAPKGAASVSGHVANATTGQPMADTRVDLTTMGLAVRTSTWTDAAGSFRVEGLPAGEYYIRATAAGFVNQSANGSLPQGPGVRVVLRATDHLSAVTVPLIPTSAIELTILDEFGDPAPGVAVQLMRRMYFAGAPHLAPPVGGGSGVSDDRGHVRIAGLYAAEFHILALPEPFAQSTKGFAPTFYPGASSADASLPVTLTPGRDSLGLSFRLAAAPMAILSGVVLEASGRPAPKVGVVILPATGTTLVPGLLMKAQTDEMGRFILRNVPSGRYAALAIGRSSSGRAVLTTSTTPEPAAVIDLKPAATLRGRIRFDMAGRPNEVPNNLTIRIQPTSILFATSGPRLYARVDDSGRFTFPDFMTEGVLYAMDAPGWAISRVLHRGQDITNIPFDSQAEIGTELEVVVTNQLGSVTGTVASPSGQPLANAHVVAYGTDSGSWIALARTSRTAQANAQGAFTISDLLPGRYLVVAAASLPAAWLEPPVSGELRAAGRPVTVTAHGLATVHLIAVR
jgi:5-hydroxyisourate hydrolase-like protein (transthyretin family)